MEMVAHPLSHLQTIYYSVGDGKRQGLNAAFASVGGKREIFWPFREGVAPMCRYLCSSPAACVLAFSPVLLSDTLVCPEGILEFTAQARVERQRKLDRIEIDLLEAARVARSCYVPVLGIEVAPDFDLDGDFTSVSHLDAERVNLVPA